MQTTSFSLLDRLRQPNPREAWVRFVDLYGPMLLHWARRKGLAEPDAEDLVQDVFARLLEKLPHFRYEPGKRFRGWLFTVALNQLRDRLRCEAKVPSGDAGPLEQLAAPDGAVEVMESEHRAYLARRALELMRAEFEPATWQACWQTVVEDRPAAEVAAALGMSENAVYIARYRVIRRLRRELDGLLD